jgi:hypothetical protein
MIKADGKDQRVRVWRLQCELLHPAGPGRP